MSAMIATWSWVTFYLIVHVLAVIIAFGPTFAYPLIGAKVAKNPQHAVFAVDIIETIAKRLTLPLGVVVAAAGTGLLYSLHIPLWSTPWLIVAILLYTAAYAYGALV